VTESTEPTPPQAPRAPDAQPQPTDAPSRTPDAIPPPPTPQRAPALPLSYTAIIAVLLVVAAIGSGLAIGTLTRPHPTPVVVVPTPTIAPTPTPQPTTNPAVFQQTFSGGCTTDQAIWVVTNGGGLVRFDGQDWTQVDSTLRTLVHASCDQFTLYAVGPVGAVMIVDDRARRIDAFDVTIEDLVGVQALPAGAVVSGQQGTVLLLNGGTWQPYAAGIEEDLNAVILFGPQSGWTVGAGGASYRLEAAGWRTIATGTTQTLRGLAAIGPANVVAVGDAGTVAHFDDHWTLIPSGVDVTLRDVIVAPDLWIVGDAGTVLTSDGAGLRRVDVGTKCDLKAVFTRANEIWIIGSFGGNGGVLRLRGGAVAERWGAC
jgi:hypothetical protein